MWVGRASGRAVCVTGRALLFCCLAALSAVMVVMNWRRTGRDGGGGDGIAAGKQWIVLREAGKEVSNIESCMQY
jgi:hypothetical protein